jgi:flagellin
MTTISAGAAFFKVQAALDRNTNSVAKSMERLATGKYGTSAGDRPSETMIANTMKSSLASNKIGLQNAREALNALDVVNNTLKTLQNMLIRLEELHALGSNGLNTDADQTSISLEAADIITNYPLVQTESKWAGTALNANFSMNYGQNQVADADLGQGGTVALTVTKAKIKDGTDSTALLKDKSVLDVAIVAAAHSYLKVTTRMSDLTALVASYSLDVSSKLDVDFAAETTELAKGQILAQAGTAMLAQANAQGQGMLALIQS